MVLGRRSSSTTNGTKAAGRTVVKALKKSEKGAAKAAKKAGAELPTSRFSSAQAKRLIGVGTTVVPLLAPYALAAATAARGRWDAYRAGRLGVPTDQLVAFSGPGGALHARLSHMAEAMTQLDSGGTVKATAAAKEFAQASQPRLADLALAVRAAEQMPSARRRTAFKAISGELDGIELALLGHLGVTA
jgi:Family of unknown function (DUF6474)